MTLTATEIHQLLTELDSDGATNFALSSDTSKSDVQAWFDGVDVEQLKSEANGEIDQTTITDLSEGSIGPSDLSIEDCIKSRGDDPANYGAAYVLRGGGTLVQYFKPKVGGKEPIPESDVQAAMQAHVDDLVSKAVSAELLTQAQAEFGA